MVWSSPQDFRAQLERLWIRGELLRDAVTGHQRFPLRLAMKGPASADITDRFDLVRAWVAMLQDEPMLRIEWQEVRHRVQGVQQLPASVWIDSVGDAIALLGKRRDWLRFASLLDMTQRQHPELLPWLDKRPLQALEQGGDWPCLLAVVDWFMAHPRPDIYLRQVDVSGVHSKFIETHRAVLAELLDLALPPDNVDATKTGVTRFAARYGFLEKPLRIRFRLLDPDNRSIAGLPCPDVTLDAESFSRLTLGVRRVLMTENETNFLALPNMSGAIAIFGSGYGWEALSQARWLGRCDLYYWGDIDTHGFAILDQLRYHFGHVESLLMDRATFETHRNFWGREDRPQRADLSRLRLEESDLYNDLRDNCLGECLRLEQEHLGFGWVRNRLDSLV